MGLEGGGGGELKLSKECKKKKTFGLSFSLSFSVFLKSF